MKRWIKAASSTMRYYIATDTGIPYRSQPENGYTKLEVIAAVQRYAKEDAKLFGGHYTDYLPSYCILDSNFHDVTDEFTNLI